MECPWIDTEDRFRQAKRQVHPLDNNLLHAFCQQVVCVAIWSNENERKKR